MSHRIDSLYNGLRNARDQRTCGSRCTVKTDLFEGERHPNLVRMAASWRRDGLDADTIFLKLREFNLEKCNPPKPEHELRGIANWMATKDPKYRPLVGDYELSQAEDLRTSTRPSSPFAPGHFDPPAPDENPSRADTPTDRAKSILSDLESCVAQALASGDVESCYAPNLAQSFAAAYECGRSVEAGAGERRLRLYYGKDLNLVQFRNGIREIRKSLAHAVAAAMVRQGWEAELLLQRADKEGPGCPAPCVTNALLYLQNHPDWKDKIAWNEFTCEPVVRKDLPPPVLLKAGEPVRDHHDTLAQSWFERETRNPKWHIDTVRRAVDAWVKENSFHPVKDYLNGLPLWDGVERLPTWLTKYCGAGPAESDDSAEAIDRGTFTSAIGERWLLSAVARIFEPGCKVDHVLVLEGPKGIGKSSVVAVLFGDWSGTITGDVSTKDNQALLSSGIWGLELDEFEILNHSGKTAVKSWVTRTSEKFRPTWGHRHEKRMRQCVFIATVDEGDWADEGDRRWWPVSCKRGFDLDGLKAGRDVLWAEALHKYHAGQRWHFDPEKDKELIRIATQEQAARVPEDVNAQSFVCAARACASHSRAFPGMCSVAEILDHLKVPIGRERKALSSQCGKALKKAGWKRERPRDDSGDQAVRYRRP